MLLLDQLLLSTLVLLYLDYLFADEILSVKVFVRSLRID